LLSLADESDHDKIVYLYTHFHDAMIRAAKRKLYMARIPNAADVAEDVVQNAFVKLTMYVKAINFNVSERELRSYVLSTVAREVINELEDRREHDDIDEYLNIASDEDFVKDVMTHERYEAVVAAIEQLDEKYRLALEYHFYKGFSVKQMAELFEMPEKTIYTRISRAQKKLKEMLGEEN
jgi:RNA polymerase sigma-70 factor (ECF subfamily)